MCLESVHAATPPRRRRADLGRPGLLIGGAGTARLDIWIVLLRPCRAEWAATKPSIPGRRTSMRLEQTGARRRARPQADRDRARADQQSTGLTIPGTGSCAWVVA